MFVIHSWLAVLLLSGCTSAVSRWNADENRVVISPRRQQSKSSAGAIQFIDNRIPQSPEDYQDYNAGTTTPGSHFHGQHGRPFQALDQPQSRYYRQHQERNNEIDYTNASQQPDRTKATWSNRAIYKTHQKGSSLIPYPGASVNVLPRSGNRKAHRGSIVATVVTPKPFVARSRPYREPYQPYAQPAGDEPARVHAECVRCPEERTVVANIGKQKVLLENPTLIPCYGKEDVSQFKFEVVFGVKPGQLIPAGTHTAVAKIINTKNFKFVQMCQWKINVIVQQCRPLAVQGNVKMTCPNGPVWGAVCQFSCEAEHHILRGSTSSTCNDNLEWTHAPPTCSVGSTCPTPAIPIRGRMSCETPPKNEVDEHNNALGNSLHGAQDGLAEGTVCHVVCAEGFRVPPRKMHLSTNECKAGRWTVTESIKCKRSRHRKHVNHPRHDRQF